MRGERPEVVVRRGSFACVFVKQHELVHGLLDVFGRVVHGNVRRALNDMQAFVAALFLSDARRILQDVDEAKRRAERIAVGKAGTLRIGIAMALSWHGMVVESFREFRRRQPDAELVLHHLISIHQIEAVLSGRLDAGFAAAVTPWNKDLAHWEFARDRILLAMPKGHRGGLGAPRIVQEASDRDTVLGLVQYGVGIAWLTESIRWHCPRGVVLLPVVDRKVRLPFNLIWKKDNSLPLLQKFVAQVQATKITPRN
jgi:DNA-binding transcriptional LysR family regulator